MKKRLKSMGQIESKIYFLRGHNVMRDKDLAELYGIETFNLNKAVTRNLDRFPADFMFRLTKEECENLIFQNGISSWGGNRKLPRVFTEHGIAMLSSVLRSKRAVQVNIAIVRAFIRLRNILSSNKELFQKLEKLEHRMERKDKEIVMIFEAIRRIMYETETKKGKIGFHVD